MFANDNICVETFLRALKILGNSLFANDNICVETHQNPIL